MQIKREGHRIDTIDFSLLAQFTAFLKPLEIATKTLKGDSYLKLHYVVLQREQLLHHVRSQPLDSPLISELKCRLRESLVSKFEVTAMHNLAMFMHPAYKGLRRLSATDRGVVYNLARSYLDLLIKLDSTSPSTSTSATSTQAGSSVDAG